MVGYLCVTGVGTLRQIIFSQIGVRLFRLTCTERHETFPRQNNPPAGLSVIALSGVGISATPNDLRTFEKR
jgi:hypothetical protein